MNQNSEKLVKHERRNSLMALLRAIQFRKSDSAKNTTSATHEQTFARPRQRARQRAMLAEESSWIRSAN